MRESSAARHFKDEPSGGTTGGIRAARLARVLVCCLFLTACQPEGGDLLPLAQEGVRIRSTKYKKDVVAQVERNEVTINAHGQWSVMRHATDFKLEITNAEDTAIAVNFKEALLVNALDEHLKVSSITFRDGSAAPASGSDFAPLIIERGQTREIDLGFGIQAQDTKSGADYLGKTATLRLPVKTGNAASGTVDFVFSFKYAEYQREAEQAATQ
ncbi:MAG: hypothetical protein LC754_05390 [Acidobacteria bacterium]|nr:hypothetical protein [Acidobacteriota bacterium]